MLIWTLLRITMEQAWGQSSAVSKHLVYRPLCTEWSWGKLILSEQTKARHSTTSTRKEERHHLQTNGSASLSAKSNSPSTTISKAQLHHTKAMLLSAVHWTREIHQGHWNTASTPRNRPPLMWPTSDTHALYALHVMAFYSYPLPTLHCRCDFFPPLLGLPITACCILYNGRCPSVTGHVTFVSNIFNPIYMSPFLSI